MNSTFGENNSFTAMHYFCSSVYTAELARLIFRMQFVIYTYIVNSAKYKFRSSEVMCFCTSTKAYQSSEVYFIFLFFFLFFSDKIDWFIQMV